MVGKELTVGIDDTGAGVGAVVGGDANVLK
jgi:hypothetical protein